MSLNVENFLFYLLNNNLILRVLHTHAQTLFFIKIFKFFGSDFFIRRCANVDNFAPPQHLVRFDKKQQNIPQFLSTIFVHNYVKKDVYNKKTYVDNPQKPLFFRRKSAFWALFF